MLEIIALNDGARWYDFGRSERDASAWRLAEESRADSGA
jgi:hypothetical protein